MHQNHINQIEPKWYCLKSRKTLATGLNVGDGVNVGDGFLARKAMYVTTMCYKFGFLLPQENFLAEEDKNILSPETQGDQDWFQFDFQIPSDV